MTRRRRLSPVFVLATAGLMALCLDGCGRRGGLEPPPDPSVEATHAGSPDGKPKRAKKTPIKAPTTPFILDPLV